MKKSFGLISLTVLLLLGLLLLFANCGKVAQEITPDKPLQPYFNIVASTDVYAKENIKVISSNLNIPTNNIFTFDDTSLYLEISGIYKNNDEIQYKELSWGQGILSIDTTKTATSNNTEKKNIYISKCLNKKGVEINNTDSGWAYLKFDDTNKKWLMMSNKIKKGANYYLVKVSTNKNKYLLKIIDGTNVSGNETVNLGSIMGYDTFISILFITDITNNKISKFINLEELSRFYNEQFFSQLNYPFPEKMNIIFQPIKDNKSNNLNLILINIYYLSKTNAKDAIKLVKTIDLSLINKKAQDILIDNINYLADKNIKEN